MRLAQWRFQPKPTRGGVKVALFTTMEQGLQILLRRNNKEILGRRKVNEGALTGSNQIQHVLQRAFAFGVPQHDAALGLLRHDQILGRVIAEILPVARRLDAARGPRADIVANGCASESRSGKAMVDISEYPS